MQCCFLFLNSMVVPEKSRGFVRVFKGNRIRAGIFIYLNGAESSSIAVSRQCQNLLMIAKNFSSEIYRVETLSGYGTNEVRGKDYFGDRSCAIIGRCLKNITVSDIKSMCALHQGAKSAMELKFWWAKNS